MEKYDLNEGNDALKRVLLMMKYDNKKTLSENTSGNGEVINESPTKQEEVLIINQEPIIPQLVQEEKTIEFVKTEKTNLNSVSKKIVSSQPKKIVKKQNLDKLVKENLKEMSVKKTNTLISETKIIKNRLNILTENISITSEKEKEKIFNKIITETFYLNSQGYNKELINESLWDILKGVFGSSSEGIFQYFKEYMAKWLITKLTPIDPEGWVGGIIIRAFGNIKLSDINKLTDCDYLSKLLTKSIVEEVIQKAKDKAGMTGAFYDILRNAVVESLDNTDFVQNIESGIAGIICPLVGGVAKKMEKKAEQMKTGAINA